MGRHLFYRAATLFAFLLFSLSLRAQVSFFQPPTYLGIGGNNVFTADFNGDGKPDLLTIDSGTPTLSFGNGDGTFKQGPAVSGSPLAVADFNGDGELDILEQGTGTLLVLLGNGDGTFQSPVSTPSGASLNAIVVTDLNGDGKSDVLGLFNGMLMVYLGKADGTFASGVPYNTSATTLNALVTAGDFNGDHKMDIVVSTSPFNAGRAGNRLSGQRRWYLAISQDIGRYF
jgi:FG-GAP-like repeat